MRGHNLYRTLQALDKLHSVQRYLRKQFHLHMTRDDAKANMDARSLVFLAQNEFMRAYGMEITKREIDSELAKEQDK